MSPHLLQVAFAGGVVDTNCPHGRCAVLCQPRSRSRHRLGSSVPCVTALQHLSGYLKVMEYRNWTQRVYQMLLQDIQYSSIVLVGLIYCCVYPT